MAALEISRLCMQPDVFTGDHMWGKPFGSESTTATLSCDGPLYHWCHICLRRPWELVCPCCGEGTCFGCYNFDEGMCGYCWVQAFEATAQTGDDVKVVSEGPALEGTVKDGNILNQLAFDVKSVVWCESS